MHGRSRWVWGTAAAITVVAAVFAFDLTPWVRGGFGWRWEYDPLPIGRWLIPILLTVVYIAGAATLLTRNARLRVLIGWAIVSSIALALSVTAAHEGDALYGLFARTVSKLATGAHWLSVQVDWAGGEWRSWTSVMRESGGHLSNLPPGLPMAYAALSGIFGASPSFSQSLSDVLLPYQCHNLDLIAYRPEQIASAAFGVLMPLWAALAVIPIAGITRRLSGDLPSRWAVLWWPLTPALMAFAGSLNTIYPLFTLAALYALIRALDASGGRRQLAWAAAGGLVTGMAAFSNFAFAPLPLILGLFALIYGLGVKRHSVGLLAGIGAAFGAGAVLPWALFGAATGLTPLDLLRTSFEFHLDLDRPYAFWTVMHVWDWLVWGGLGLAVMAVVSALGARRKLDGGAALSAALVAGMILLTLSGTARGETGRVWLVFTPLLVLAGADGLRRITGPHIESWALLSVSGSALALVLALSLPVVGTDLTPPPAQDASAAARPAETAFVDDGRTVFQLVAWDAVQNGDSLDVQLTFNALVRSREAYYLGGVLVAPDGSTTPSEAQQPVNANGTAVPATCWTPGAPLSVHMTQPLPSGLATDNAYLSLATYGAEPGEGPLSTSDGDVQVGLGPIAIGEN